MQPVGNVLKDSHLAKEDVDEIVLVGGSTRIPKVQQLVKVFQHLPAEQCTLSYHTR